MKTLTPEQYAFLFAIKKDDQYLSWQLADACPSTGELAERGLYINDGLVQGKITYGSLKITTEGLIAIECYQAIHGVIQV